MVNYYASVNEEQLISTPINFVPVAKTSRKQKNNHLAVTYAFFPWLNPCAAQNITNVNTAFMSQSTFDN